MLKIEHFDLASDDSEVLLYERITWGHILRDLKEKHVSLDQRQQVTDQQQTNLGQELQAADQQQLFLEQQQSTIAQQVTAERLFGVLIK